MKRGCISKPKEKWTKSDDQRIIVEVLYTKKKYGYLSLDSVSYVTLAGLQFNV